MVADLPWDDDERELSALYEIIGQLVVEYARAEAYVHLLACRVLGNDSTGLVVFDGMRLGDLAKRIRGMLRVQKTPNEDFSDINSCLTQLDAIGNVRQRLAHRFVNMQPGAIETHNLYTAKTVEGQEIDRFEPHQIADMIADCHRIRVRILRHTDGEARRRERHDPDWSPALFAPWRYTPPQPLPRKDRQRPKVRDARIKPPHPPRASRE